MKYEFIVLGVSVALFSPIVLAQSAAPPPGTAPAPTPPPTVAPAPTPAPAAPPTAAPPPSYPPNPTYGAPPGSPPPQAPPQYPAPQPQYPAPQQQNPAQPQPYGQPQPGYGTVQQQPQPEPYNATAAGPAAAGAGVGGAWTAQEARVILSAERLFGFYAFSGTLEPDAGDDVEFSGTMINLLYGNGSTNDPFFNLVNPHALPRLGIDGVLGGAFTLGGSVGFVSTSGEVDTGTTTVDFPDVSGVAFHGRFGYLYAPNEVVAIWPRAGIEYFSATSEFSEADYELKYSGLAITIDPQLVITPVPHAGILIGPLASIGVSGSLEETESGTTDEFDFKLTNFGLTAGLALLF